MVIEAMYEEVDWVSLRAVGVWRTKLRAFVRPFQLALAGVQEHPEAA